MPCDHHCPCDAIIQAIKDDGGHTRSLIIALQEKHDAQVAQIQALTAKLDAATKPLADAVAKQSNVP